MPPQGDKLPSSEEGPEEGKAQRSSELMTEQKRARNRLSQRYFRERRKLRLKELETQVQSLSATDSDRTARLAAENAKLRNSLVQTRKRMAQLKSMIASLDETLEGLLDASYLTTTCMQDATQKVATSKEQDPTGVPTLPDAVTPAIILTSLEDRQWGDLDHQQQRSWRI
ncbi:hypothetical protein PENARI_c051G04957 [Penicillium arizonense]|uniref:BZIP domain-containing protein n=1 Tax=Penicillium arizonense TaxID=1835702 RepID=A0A1F5L268_PENAI|nr:hypothetical protein PENARI_c051G04957 [Penicillium arizonense]OGE47292.1 hypothetical protein PENARI_c051G04957 [Penicillium arizonense]